MSEYLITILKEMCRRVEANYDEINFKDPWWFHSCSWSQEEEDNFVKWLSNYIYTNKDARWVMTTISNNTKKNSDLFAKHFVWNYGWRINPDNEIA